MSEAAAEEAGGVQHNDGIERETAIVASSPRQVKIACEDDEIDGFPFFPVVHVEDDNESEEAAKPRKSKREKRLEKRDRRRAEGSANRQGYGHTPEATAAKVRAS
jgi:hypothetical protein